jgi:hypothetical protein
MDTNELDELIANARREIQQMPFSVPGKGEFYGECHWSRTGWAVWKMGDMQHGSYCTCRPTKNPHSTDPQ